MPIIICTPLKHSGPPVVNPEFVTDGETPIVITLGVGSFVSGVFVTPETRTISLKANSTPYTVFETDPTYAPSTITLKANAVPPTVFETDPAYAPSTITLKARGIAS